MHCTKPLKKKKVLQDFVTITRLVLTVSDGSLPSRCFEFMEHIYLITSITWIGLKLLKPRVLVSVPRFYLALKYLLCDVRTHTSGLVAHTRYCSKRATGFKIRLMNEVLKS